MTKRGADFEFQSGLLHSPSWKYPWERYESLFATSSVLNSRTCSYKNGYYSKENVSAGARITKREVKRNEGHVSIAATMRISDEI